MADARLSQLPLEVLRGPVSTTPLRLSQLPLEVLRGPLPPTPVYLSQLPLEVLLRAPAVGGGESVQTFVWMPL